MANGVTTGNPAWTGAIAIRKWRRRLRGARADRALTKKRKEAEMPLMIVIAIVVTAVACVVADKMGWA